MPYIDTAIADDDFCKDLYEGLGRYFIDDEILENIFSIDNIKKVIITGSMEVYYNYFPITEQIVVPVSGGSTETYIDAPETTLGIVHYALTNNNGGSGNLNSGNPFYTQSQLMSIGGSSYRSSYGTPFNYMNGGGYSSYQEKFYGDSMIAQNKVYTVDYDEINNRFILKSATSGHITITVGKYDPVVNHIPKRLRPMFQRHCEANLKLKFADALSMLNADLPLEFDKELMRDSAIEEIEKIEEWWIENSTIQAMR